VLLAACGDVPTGGPQDTDEPRGNYEVAVDASFDPAQKLAKRSTMTIVVRNLSGEVIPNVNVTLGENQNNGRGDDTERIGDFYRRKDDENQSDPNRPQFVVNKAPIDFVRDQTTRDRPNPPDTRRFELERKFDKDADVVQGEVIKDTGDDPTYVDTYELGRLDPGQSRRFRWNITAVEAGPYEIRWRVQAGLDGLAKAVLPGGRVPRGRFVGVVSSGPPSANVNFADGHSVER
jgi:prepilin-type processing-associated H-X9-DG protein